MNTFHVIIKYFSDKVLPCRTTGDNIVEESQSLPVGIGVELYARHHHVDLRLGVETTAFQVPRVLLHLGGDEQDVSRLKVAVLQTEHTLRGQTNSL